ncbi:hypothetical protein U14_03147 [Candidatus Moduliflexus flocculans]|uniref:Glycosyltransferase RgtA/B/C/D-like domain-containing protein n=1 Tax=Candidatus Moduliflexus flocculans TaxID=1499966 RepID=A0A081BND5_9BACT|nr:hypothetical protein U14_03147 [Candidatus Moduliflexus flocculans]
MSQIFPYQKIRRFLALRWHLWIPLFAAGGQLLLFGLVYPKYPDTIFSPDSVSYIQTAKAFAATGHFAKSPELLDIPQLARTPGYPLFLACFFLLAGERYALIIVAQIILSGCTIFLAARIALNRWQDKNIATLAALLLTIDISSTVASQQILTETLFTFVLTVALWMSDAAFERTASAWRIAVFSGLLAVATLIRPISYYLIFPISLLALYSLRTRTPRQRWRVTLSMMAALLLPWLTLIGGWQTRNFLVAGTTEFCTIQSVNLLFYRGAGIVAQRDGISFGQAQEQLGYGRTYSQIHPETRNWTEAQVALAWKQEGLDLIYHYPVLTLKSQFNGLIKLLFSPGERTLLGYLGEDDKLSPIQDFFTLAFADFIDKWTKRKSFYLVFSVYTVTYLLLIYAGILTSGWQRIQCKTQLRFVDIRHAFVGVITVYMLILSSGPEAYSRFRIPIMPIFCLYAAKGIIGWFPVVRNKLATRQF